VKAPAFGCAQSADAWHESELPQLRRSPRQEEGTWWAPAEENHPVWCVLPTGKDPLLKHFTAGQARVPGAPSSLPPKSAMWDLSTGKNAVFQIRSTPRWMGEGESDF